ncbi:MAG TPA: exodeoxyribonuclease VII large subunit [Candidatus Saccharimonadales bacterium]|jgi:exodeoxyribonuclease VII large subunit|nr:exodeoxyribonuclease VII large subunit [Candidatus Saccharimonadales bacterium]
MEKNGLQLTVSDFIALTNQTLEYAYPSVEVEGEVASFKVNQGKYVFFDIKDAGGSINCFMTVWQLRVPIEDGMKVIVVASPKLTQWGKFSLTVRAVRPSGEGSIKKSFELLREKLNKEGLFAPERKRPLPGLPQHVAVISSTQAAGYADFIKIIDDRWGGLQIDVASVQVQGASAPDQMIQALKYFNSQEDLPEVIIMIRGGGSADDLSAFNDELLVREIAASRVPTLVGVGHEVDVSLADMVADVRAATPSNAAQILVPDRTEVIRAVRRQVQSLLPRTEQAIDGQIVQVRRLLGAAIDAVDHRHDRAQERLNSLRRVLAELDPRKVLARGYALVRGDMVKGGVIEIEKSDIVITAEVQHVSKK